MSRVCALTGKSVQFGHNVSHSNRKTNRRFQPNLQRVNALVDGTPKRITVSTRALRQGLVVKPLKRKYGYTRQQKKDTRSGE